MSAEQDARMAMVKARIDQMVPQLGQVYALMLPGMALDFTFTIPQAIIMPGEQQQTVKGRLMLCRPTIAFDLDMTLREQA